MQKIKSCFLYSHTVKDGKVVKSKVTAKNVLKLDAKIVANFLDNIKPLIRKDILGAALIEKNKDREIPDSTIMESWDLKDNVVYFEDLYNAARKFVEKSQSVAVNKSRIVYKGKGSNYKTLVERLELCGI